MPPQSFQVKHEHMGTQSKVNDSISQFSCPFECDCNNDATPLLASHHKVTFTAQRKPLVLSIHFSSPLKRVWIAHFKCPVEYNVTLHCVEAEVKQLHKQHLEKMYWGLELTRLPVLVSAMSAARVRACERVIDCLFEFLYHSLLGLWSSKSNHLIVEVTEPPLCFLQRNISSVVSTDLGDKAVNLFESCRTRQSVCL